MQVRLRSNGQITSLNSKMKIAAGGEGAVYQLPNSPDSVAKIYHPDQATFERGRKIEVMLNNPPNDPMKKKGHASIAWATDVIEYTGQTGGGLTNSQIIGFIMPKMKGQMKTIVEFYDRKSRIIGNPAFSYDYLLSTARNLVSAVCAIHENGYIIGDVNQSNIMVDPTNTYITMIDTDSFQVTDPKTNKVYRSTVWTPDFTPPELQGEDFTKVVRTVEHDLFGIAVILFQLLMENTQPFGGIFKGRGDPPEYSSRIRNGHFIYSEKRSVPYKPNKWSPPFDILHPAIRRLFLRCFEEGHTDPKARPTAREWKKILDSVRMKQCSRNDKHFYFNHLTDCCWCRMAQRLGIDAFPSKSQLNNTQSAFLRKVKKPRQPAFKFTKPPILKRRVPPLPPVVRMFQAVTPSITAGQSCRISWQVSNAQSVTINNGIGSVHTNGSVSVTPSRSTTYILTAISLGGTVIQTVRLHVKLNPILSFTANNLFPTVNQPPSLSWSVAPNYTVSINQGIGRVANTGQISPPTKFVRGWFRLSEKIRTTYELTAQGSGGTFQQKLTVETSLSPLPVDLNKIAALNSISTALREFIALSRNTAILNGFRNLRGITALGKFQSLRPVTSVLNNYIALNNSFPALPGSLPSAPVPFYKRVVFGFIYKARKLFKS